MTDGFETPGADPIEASACPGCGLVLPAAESPTHPYIGASEACWALYGELLAREYSHAAYYGVHQLTVDTYAVQHPGVPERRSIQSVALHLMTLQLFLEQGTKLSDGPKLHQRMSHRHSYHWLDPPSFSDRMTVTDVLAARNVAEHHELVWAWARDVWEAWSSHHSVVRDWVRQSLA